MSGASVREVRALEIGVAAAHQVAIHGEHATETALHPHAPTLPCRACEAWADAIRRAIAEKAHVGLVTPMGVAVVALFDELRREADEQAAPR